MHISKIASKMTKEVRCIRNIMTEIDISIRVVYLQESSFIVVLSLNNKEYKKGRI
jgi:hypothetical protein